MGYEEVIKQREYSSSVDHEYSQKILWVFKCYFQGFLSNIKAGHRNKCELLAIEEMSQRQSTEMMANLSLLVLNMYSMYTKYDGILASSFRLVC